MNENPYAAPASPSSPQDLQTSPSVEIRQTHLKHEASVKSIGTLYILGGIFLTISAVIGITGVSSSDQVAHSIGFVVGFLTIALLQLWLGLSLRKLKKGARIPAIVVAVIGLLGFPIGTLISAYILYLLCSQKGKMVFSPEYAQVIADTPEIKYRTSKLVWIILILFILLLVAGFFFATSR